MIDYAALAQELLHALDTTGPRPPHENISQTQRGEMAVLRLLARERRQMLAGEISRSLSMTTSRIAAVLNRLEKKEMITRLPDPADRRRVAVALTARGESFHLARRREAEQDFKKDGCSQKKVDQVRIPY